MKKNVIITIEVDVPDPIDDQHDYDVYLRKADSLGSTVTNPFVQGMVEGLGDDEANRVAAIMVADWLERPYNATAQYYVQGGDMKVEDVK